MTTARGRRRREFDGGDGGARGVRGGAYMHGTEPGPHRHHGVIATPTPTSLPAGLIDDVFAASNTAVEVVVVAACDGMQRLRPPTRRRVKVIAGARMTTVAVESSKGGRGGAIERVVARTAAGSRTHTVSRGTLNKGRMWGLTWCWCEVR